MKKYSIFFKSTLIAMSLLTLSSCNDDDTSEGTNDDDVEVTETTSKYIIALQDYAVGEEDEVDYVLEYSDLNSLTSGTINAEGQGIPQPTWTYFYSVNNTVFAFDYDPEVPIGRTYQLDENGEVFESSTFMFNTSLNAFSDLDGENLLAFELSFGGYTEKGFYTFNAESGSITSEEYDYIDTEAEDGTIDTTLLPDSFVLESAGYTPWVTGAILRDGNLYVSYYKFDGYGYTQTPDTDRAYVAVYDYPNIENGPTKIIEDDRTSPIGTNGHSSGLVIDENNDIYSFSSSSLSSGYSSASKPSGILKITDGETEFDENYFFDVENTTNGGKIFWMDYVGNGKALARIVIDDTNGAGVWGTYFNYEGLKLVVLDLENQRVTDVSGIDYHVARYTSKLFIEDGIAYLGAETGADAASAETAIYAVDVETATATKGAVVEGKSIKGIYKISN